MQRRLIDAAFRAIDSRAGIMHAMRAAVDPLGRSLRICVSAASTRAVVLTWDAPAGLPGATLSCAAHRLPRVPDLGSRARLQGCRFWAVELRQQTVTLRTASTIRSLCEPPTAESARHSGTHLVSAAGSRDAAVLRKKRGRDKAPVRLSWPPHAPAIVYASPPGPASSHARGRAGPHSAVREVSFWRLASVPTPFGRQFGLSVGEAGAQCLGSKTSRSLLPCCAGRPTASRRQSCGR